MSHDVIPQRYQPTYREDEIDLILRFALRGESLGFVGIAGVGKSNLVNFLRNIQRNAQRIEQNVEPMHFPIIDATHWPGDPISLWKMMLDALNQATKGLAPFPEDNKVIPISEEERALSTLRARLGWICQELQHKVMFVLDDFDVVFETGPLAMLERLNSLRSEGNRGHLSYLVLTKRLPHILGQSQHIENGSKFYDLFRHNLYALEPYVPDDARQMLAHLNEVAGKPLSNRDLAQIRALAGGHARLLKIVFDIWINEGAPNAADPVAHLVAKPDVQQECRRILLGLHEQEQEVALLIARGRQTADHQEIVDHLTRRGLLSAPTTWFSPLFAQFLSTYDM
jgi:hypothetical protein